jgi:phospholipid/cholesterol/gamma-HCH transport system substrate-binding protein
MKRNVVETLVGALVLLVAAIFGYFTYSVSEISGSKGYVLEAQFQNLDGITPGTDVKLSGIKVGRVIGVILDPKTYLAMLQIDIRNDVQIPVDTVAVVATEGLLGGRYVKLLPGASDDNLKPGARIQYTQGPVDIAELLGRVFFSAANNTSSTARAPGATTKPSGALDLPTPPKDATPAQGQPTSPPGR